MRRSLAAVWLLVLAAAAPAQDTLAARLEAVTEGPDYKHAHWGVLIADAKTGKPLYEKNADKLFAPASTTKLFSCAAALLAYGPDFRFDTPVFRRGDVDKNGVLHGDLILLASGDPSFGGRTVGDKMAFQNHDHTYANSGLADSQLTDTDPLAAVDELAKQVKAAGIKEVTGEVLVDDRLFDPVRGSGSGPDSVTPIMVNDNVVDLLITPAAKPGELAKVVVRPECGFIKFDAEVATGEKDGPTTVTLEKITATDVSVRGTVPAGGKPLVRIVPVDEPVRFARGLFVEALKRQGVRTAAAVAGARSIHLPAAGGYEQLTKVAIYTSPPFRELTKVTLKVSHNLYASALPCLVGVKAGKRTLEDGLKEQGRLLKELGVDVAGISFGGGAGGSPADSVSPRAAVQLLRGMKARPEWPAFQAGLPALGVDGTLAETVPAESPARGKAFAKTGTLIWTDGMNGRGLLKSKALAGVLTTKSGRELVFAFYVNDVPLPPGVVPGREGKVLGRLCEIVYQNVD